MVRKLALASTSPYRASALICKKIKKVGTMKIRFAWVWSDKTKIDQLVIVWWVQMDVEETRHKEANTSRNLGNNQVWWIKVWWCKAALWPKASYIWSWPKLKRLSMLRALYVEILKDDFLKTLRVFIYLFLVKNRAQLGSCVLV